MNERGGMNHSAPKLPNTLSALLFLAVEDARTLDRTQYEPRYSFWHHPVAVQRPTGIQPACRVCTAGALIAGTLGYAPETKFEFSDQYTPDEFRLLAVERVRMGNVPGALGDMETSRILAGEPAGPAWNRLEWEDWKPRSPAFRTWFGFDEHLSSIETLAKRLERAGL